MFLTRSAMFASPLGERLAFYSMTGRETLGQLFSYEVDLLSSDDSLDLSELLGQGASVVFERTNGTIREFSGFVTQFSLVGEHGNFARYRALLRPWLWFMGQNRNSRSFKRRPCPRSSRAFRERGFTDVEDKLHGKYPTLNTWFVSRIDLNFKSADAEQEGIYYFLKHAGVNTRWCSPTPQPHEPNYGYQTVPYFPR